jgi:hypothetical protein
MKPHNFLLSLFAAAPMLAAACGVCIEDKMAATYDHAVITSAVNQGHAVVFAEMIGVPSSNAAQTRKIIQAFEATPGVDRGSVRVSLNPAAISFAIDERKTEVQGIFAAAKSTLKSGVRFEIIRTLRHL